MMDITSSVKNKPESHQRVGLIKFSGSCQYFFNTKDLIKLSRANISKEMN